jgi:two-component system OmpR family response regulator
MPTAGHRPDTILVVDDDEAICALVAETLRDEGFRVVAAPSHADALVALSAVRFALVLADAPPDAPALDEERWAGLDRLRAAAATTPVIICTAYRPALFDGWRERGYADLIAKPFDLDDLAAQVRAHAYGPHPA